MDRNFYSWGVTNGYVIVALRKESVDRNRLFGYFDRCHVRSLSARRAWIEIAKSTPEDAKRWSLSARRAWIEITAHTAKKTSIAVALRKESVDRNFIGSRHRIVNMSLSARRAWIEILGRSCPCRGRDVALRKESVDRNSVSPNRFGSNLKSLSARRAWIEICCPCGAYNARQVALRKESVDRNISCMILMLRCCASLSARRAWIEILPLLFSILCCDSRSPQGERG